MTPLADLEARLLAAHEADSPCTLATLYAEAAEITDQNGATDQAAFFLTQAWIFALEAGRSDAETLAAKLRRMKRLRW